MRSCAKYCWLIALACRLWAGDNAKPAAAGILWREPGDISKLDLLYGSGGKKDAPQPDGTYTFEKEDLDGTNPKFVVRDQDGTRWKVKLGVEAKPETAASRLVWAAGYSTTEDYFLPRLSVKGLPAHLKRGQNLEQPGGTFLNVRLKRYSKHEDKDGTWSWRDNPFTGTREFDGLRVMMALINNWDLKDENNKVYDTEDGKVYLVSDLGASFGTTGESWTHARSKGNLDQYRKSKFIAKTSDEYVSFGTPSTPAPIFLFNPHEFFSRVQLEWIGHRIPRNDVKWISMQLSKLSPEQITDAFRAAGYTPEEATAFAAVVQRRITDLQGI